MQRTRARLVAALWLSLLLAAPLLVLGSSLFGDDLPLSLRSVYFFPPWEEARPQGLKPQYAPLDAEHALRLYPWYVQLHAAGESGEIPLWNPQEGLGAPFLALWHTRVFSPFSIPIYFLPLQQGIALSLFLKMAVAGFMAWYVARRFGYHRPTAFFAAITFQWSAPVLGWLAMPMADVVVWMPLAWYALERFSLGKVALWPKAGVVFALMGLGGAPNVLAAFAILGVLYILLRTLFDHASAHPFWASFGYALGWLAGGGLLAVQLFPYIEYLGEAAAWLPGPGTPAAAGDWVALISPELLAPARLPVHPIVSLLHPGLVPWILLFVWIALRKHARPALRARLEAMLIASAALAAVGWFAQGLWMPLPALKRFTPEHWMAAWPMAMAFTSAGAIEEWMAINADAMKNTLRRLIFLGPAAVLSVIAALITGVVGGGGDLLTNLYVPLALILLIAALGRTIFKPSLPMLALTACGISLCGLYLAQGRHLPTTPMDDVFPETAFIDALRKMNARLGGTPALQQWPLAGNGIAQVYTPGGAVLRRYRGFMDRAQQDPQLLRRTGSQALLLQKDDIQGTFAPLRSVLRIEEVFPAGAVLFRDLQSRPRTAMIYAGRPVERFDPVDLDSYRPPLLEGATLPETDDGREATATVVEDRPDTVSVRVGETRPGVLVLADAYYPGWQATVDGRPTPVLPVDGLFRGVEVGAGEHEVVFNYQPMSLQAGATTSGLSLLVVLIALRPWRNRRRRRAEKAEASFPRE